jgi:hypothetical protein
VTREPCRDEAVLDLGELVDEERWTRVGAVDRLPLQRQQQRTGATQPLRDEPEALPVRLVREPPAQLARRSGQGPLVAVSRCSSVASAGASRPTVTASVCINRVATAS